MKIAELLEALKPSEYRSLIKGWNKKRYADLFKKYTSDRNGYRIYIPLKGNAEKISAPSAIAKAIAAAGYEIEDYATGIASKDGGKRKVKIGKLLKDPDLLKQFSEDPKRGGAKRSDYVVVISRHPYDLAGMSTDRGWTSCMNLKDGCNKHYVPLDIKGGTLIAYLIKGDDKNISAPVARMLIKPFTNKKLVALGIENEVYGTNVAGFTRTVMDWVAEINESNDLNGIFKLKRDLYSDSLDKRGKLQFRDGVELSKYVEWPADVAGADLTDKELIAIIKEVGRDGVGMLGGTLLKYLPGASKAVQMAAITVDPRSAMFDIKDPSEELQLFAVKLDPKAIRFIKNPTDKVKAAAEEGEKA